MVILRVEVDDFSFDKTESGRQIFSRVLFWGDLMINEYEEMKKVIRMSKSGDTRSDASVREPSKIGGSPTEIDSMSTAGLTNLSWKCKAGVCTLQWKPRKEEES